MGKLGDLAGFTSAIAIAMIALLIGHEAISRLFAPVPINFTEALPIAFLGLAVNIASVWLIGGEHHGHSHGHGHGHVHSHSHDDAPRELHLPTGTLALSVFEDNHPPVFRIAAVKGVLPSVASVVTIRPDRALQRFSFADHGTYLQSVEEIPEPHAFTADVRVADQKHSVVFEEHSDHDPKERTSAQRDNNMRAAVVHVLADAAVSGLVIVGLALAWAFGWLWMDPLAGIIGTIVIASWSYSLVRDTGAVLLDMVPDRGIARQVRATIESEGDQLTDFQLWRLGPGHLGAILSVVTRSNRTAEYYREKLARFRSLSHVTVEVSYMFIYALYLSNTLEQPFRKGHPSLDDVSLFLLREFAEKVRPSVSPGGQDHPGFRGPGHYHSRAAISRSSGPST